MSQTVLAERTGSDQGAISRMEKGVSGLQVVEFVALAHEIGEDPLALLEEALRSAKQPDLGRPPKPPARKPRRKTSKPK